MKRKMPKILNNKNISKMVILMLSVLFLFCAIFSGNLNGEKIFADSLFDTTAKTTAQILYPNFSISDQEDSSIEFYIDLTNVKLFDLNSDNIFYTLDNSSLIVSNRETKISSVINSFTNIEYIKSTKNFLFILDNGTLKIYDNSQFNKFGFSSIEIKNLSGLNNINSLGVISQMHISESSNEIQLAIMRSTNISVLFLKSTNLEQSNLNYSLPAIAGTIKNFATNSLGIYVVTDNSGLKVTYLVYGETALGNYYYFPQTVSKLVCLKYNSIDYLATISQDNKLYLIKPNLSMGQSADNIALPETIANNGGFLLGTIGKAIDLKFFGNQLYVADFETKAITIFNIVTRQDDTTKADYKAYKILIASTCGEIGWFNDNSKVVANGNLIYVADSINNRIEILNSLTASKIENPINSTINLSNLIVDSSKNVIYFSVNNTLDNYAKIAKYSTQTSSILETFSTMKISGVNSNLDKIFGACLVDGDLYAINASGLFSNSANASELTQVITTLGGFNSNSSINSFGNNLLIYNGNSLNIVSTSGTIISSLSISNLVSITVDANLNIFALVSGTTNKISKYNFDNNNLLEISSISDTNFNKYSSISIDKTSNVLYAFNDKINCIEKIYRPLFNLVENSKTAITINQRVAVYSAPNFLNGDPNSIKVYSLPLNTILTLYSSEIITYGENEFYIVKINTNSFGYVNVADVVFNTSNIINTLQKTNAKISLLNNETNANIYNSATSLSTIVDSLENNYEIIAVSYTSEAEFTFIRYYDETQVLHTGYVKTTQIKLNEFNSNEIVALIIVGVCLILGVILLIIYRKSRKTK